MENQAKNERVLATHSSHDRTLEDTTHRSSPCPLHTPPITLATGGSRGPGRNTALRIARGGGDVFLTSRRQAAVADTAALRRRAVALRFDNGNITTFGAFTEHLRAVPQQTRQRAPASTIWSTPLAMVTGGAPKTSRQHGQAPRR